MKKKEKLYVGIFIFLAVILIVFLLVLGLRQRPKKDEQGRTLIGIDDPNYDPDKDPDNPFNDNNQDEEGNYYYENKGLGFSLKLPPEFIYFQTQRWDDDSFSDLEILVPTNDPKYTRATPPSYAKPLIIRVWRDKNAWRKKGGENGFSVFSEEEDRVYSLKFWSKPSKDWKEKWNNTMESNIKNSIKLIK